MSEMRRANAREEESRLRDRSASTIVIAASIIAAVGARARTYATIARLVATILDSVSLARSILKRVLQ